MGKGEGEEEGGGDVLTWTFNFHRVPRVPTCQSRRGRHCCQINYVDLSPGPEAPRECFDVLLVVTELEEQNVKTRGKFSFCFFQMSSIFSFLFSFFLCTCYC